MTDNIVSQQTHAKTVIKKSSFFAYAMPVRNYDEVKHIVKDITQKHKKAKHVAYAYILSTQETRFNDDREPSRTAGYPLLKILQRSRLTYTLLVVARVFGGIKLGTSGLYKAYAQAAKEALKQNTIIKRGR